MRFELPVLAVFCAVGCHSAVEPGPDATTPEGAGGGADVLGAVPGTDTGAYYPAVPYGIEIALPSEGFAATVGVPFDVTLTALDEAGEVVTMSEADYPHFDYPAVMYTVCGNDYETVFGVDPETRGGSSVTFEGIPTAVATITMGTPCDVPAQVYAEGTASTGPEDWVHYNGISDSFVLSE